MAKAILVIDMPKDCGHCIFFDKTPDRTYCHLCDVDVSEFTRMNMCPLIEEPPQATPDNSDMSVEWNLGWNACLDYLEGKENE